MNIVILSGNLTRDPEMRYTPSGQAVCEATVAVSKRWLTESGEEKERVAFPGLVIWGKRGEAFAKHHRKGSKVLIRGELVQETWEDKETGKKREKTRVQVEDWEFAGPKPADGPSEPPKPAPKSHPSLPLGNKADPADAEAEDDVPF